MIIQIEKHLTSSVGHTFGIGRYFYLDMEKIGITTKITKDKVYVYIEENKISYLNNWVKINYFKNKKNNIG